MLSDRDILEQLRIGNLRIDPFNDEQLQPASYDVTLGKWIWVPYQPEIIDPYTQLGGQYQDIELNRFYLPPLSYVLGVTNESFEIGSDMAAQVGGKSSLGRLGLTVHITAGFVDPGFRGPITLEIFNHHPKSSFALRPNMPVAQIIFMALDNRTEKPYSGKYQGAFAETRPQPSMYFKNKRPS